MFTGIVDHCGRIETIENHGKLKCRIRCEFTDLVEGESISVDGVCLTALQVAPQSFACDISPETIALTKAANYSPGQRVNLERALRMMDRLGGHWVTGHADQSGRITSKQSHGEFTELSIGGIRPEHQKYVIRKGSLAVNGTSLTINDAHADSVSLMLIPHTLERTNLGELAVGDWVNLEFDWLVKVVLNEARRLELLGPTSEVRS